MYMLELIPVGICGLMPGLALTDVLNRVFQARLAGRSAEAFALFEKVLPQILFCLQTLELYHYCEKRLLQAMGLLTNTICRAPAYTPDPDTARFVDELNARVLAAMRECGTPIG